MYTHTIVKTLEVPNLLKWVEQTFQNYMVEPRDIMLLQISSGVMRR